MHSLLAYCEIQLLLSGTISSVSASKLGYGAEKPNHVANYIPSFKELIPSMLRNSVPFLELLRHSPRSLFIHSSSSASKLYTPSSCSDLYRLIQCFPHIQTANSCAISLRLRRTTCENGILFVRTWPPNCFKVLAFRAGKLDQPCRHYQLPFSHPF